MNRKIIILFIAAFIIAAITNYKVFADDSLRQNRIDILKNMKKNTSIERNRRVYRTEHFNIFTDEESIERYNIVDYKKFEASMLRVCYIFEEAYIILQNMTSGKAHGKFDVGMYEPEVYMKQHGTRKLYFLYYRGSQARICVSGESFVNPLDNFESDIASLYRIFARMFLHAKWGAGLSYSDTREFCSYFGEVGRKTSRWGNTLTDKERQQIIDEIDVNYTFLFKKYPDIFTHKEVNKVYMECRWCHKNIDITKIRKGSRIKCPHCRKTITVE